MLRSARRAGAVAGLLALAVVTALGGAATAAPSGSKSPSQAMADAAKGSGGSGRLKVVAEGLDNPRGIGFGPDGALYVAESGSGGAGPCVAGPEGADVCFGRSGGVTRITKRSQQRVLSGLPPAGGGGRGSPTPPPPRLASPPAPPGIPGLPPELESQAVPTSVVKGPDGAFYVGQLTGFPFPVGGASVFRVVPGKAPTVFAGGFTNIIDIAFDKRGRLYVLEIATGGLLNTPPDQLPAGRLVRVNRDGSQTTLASEGLNAPGGFVLGHGAAYITNNSILSDAGQVVKVRI